MNESAPAFFCVCVPWGSINKVRGGVPRGWMSPPLVSMPRCSRATLNMQHALSLSFFSSLCACGSGSLTLSRSSSRPPRFHPTKAKKYHRRPSHCCIVSCTADRVLVPFMPASISPLLLPRNACFLFLFSPLFYLSRLVSEWRLKSARPRTRRSGFRIRYSTYVGKKAQPTPVKNQPF